jgi:hypothetical protein
MSELDAAYRERNAVVAALVRLFPSGGFLASEDGDGEWRIYYVDLPAGQVSWHVGRADWDLFDRRSTSEAQLERRTPTRCSAGTPYWTSLCRCAAPMGRGRHGGRCTGRPRPLWGEGGTEAAALDDLANSIRSLWRDLRDEPDERLAPHLRQQRDFLKRLFQPEDAA